MGENRIATVAWLAAASVLIAACSSGGGDESAVTSTDDLVATDDGVESTTGTSLSDQTDVTEPAVTEPGTTLPMAPVTTAVPVAEVALVIDDETGLPVEVEELPSGPLTYDEIVDRGIGAGIWTEADGLARSIGHAAGVVPDELVPGVETLVNGAITGLLDRANELGASGQLSDAEAENLQIFYEAAMPPEEVRNRLEAGAEPSGPGEGLRIRGSQGSCVPVDPANFTQSAWVEGCYRADVHDIGGHTVRIMYPTWFDDDETLAGWPLFAFEVLRQSFEVYAPLATLGDMDVVFSATDASSGVLGIAVADEQWQDATISGPCPIVMFPNAQATDDRFRQTIAHEVWHCVQHYSAGLQDFGTTRWFLEGAAEFFSNVVYPSSNQEHVWLNSFDRRSRTSPLYDFDYHTWIWWQHLANRTSPRAVADLNWDMVAAGDGGRALMAERAGEFQRFVVDFVAGTVADQGGTNIRRARNFNTPRVDVVKNDEGTIKKFTTEPMVASRFMVRYEKQLRFLQSDQTTDGGGEHAMVEYDRRSDPAEWKQIHPEVRSTCDDPIWYIVVATSGEDSYEVQVQIDTTEQAVCDPCLLGTWSMQLDTFETMLLNAIAAEGGLPPGVSFDIVSGEYLLAFDAEGGLTEQRAALTIRATSGAGGFDFTIDSFAEGDYQADGENISATDIVESSVSVDAGPASIFTSSGSTTSGSGTYDCDRDVFVVTIQGFDPVTFDRVDRILQPDDTIPA